MRREGKRELGRERGAGRRWEGKRWDRRGWSFRGRKKEEGETKLAQRDPSVRHRPTHGARQMASARIQTTTLKACSRYDSENLNSSITCYLFYLHDNEDVIKKSEKACKKFNIASVIYSHPL
jgi:hypothetical protein